MFPSAHSGFTRTDLCVVIVVLLVLGGLFIPLLGRTRDKNYHQTSCINNQKEIGLAWTLYATTQGKLPPSISSHVDSSTGKKVTTPLGWAQGIFAQLGRPDLVPDADTMTVANAPRIDLLICPTDMNKRNAQGGSLSYVVNAGSFKHWHPDGSFDCLDRGVWSTSDVPAAKRSSENFFRNKGTAFTICLGENIDALSYIPTSLQADYEDSLLWDPSAPLGFNEDAGNGKLDNTHARPSSFHPGGAIVTFCDVHTAFVSDSIDYKVYATLMAVDPMTASPGGKQLDDSSPLAGILISPFDGRMIPTK